ncbi:hypothetical protein GCM10027440_52060 [Nocardiopsis coralliicola]
MLPVLGPARRVQPPADRRSERIRGGEPGRLWGGWTAAEPPLAAGRSRRVELRRACPCAGPGPALGPRSAAIVPGEHCPARRGRSGGPMQHVCDADHRTADRLARYPLGVYRQLIDIPQGGMMERREGF